MQVCDYTIEGNPEGPTLVFIHGWPDNASLWRHQVAALASDHRCVLVTLPNFGEDPVRAGGFSFPALTELLVNTISEVQPEGRVTLVTHDWGAYLGYLVEQACPARIERMVAMDVGGRTGKPSFAAALMILGYQWALVLCWFLGGLIPPLGNALTQGVAKVVKVPDRQRHGVRSRFNYPYFYLWQGILLPWKRDGILQRYQPKCPVVYLYGTRKPFQFHSEGWLKLVAASGGFARGIDAGHWLQEQRAEEVNALILDWMSAARNPA
ncbi:MAG: alpha/beta fold hydrolase [Xanthomonadales bacterium]|jgi:pimeloyl-ACP methyl ester carboxylesterase|nr:alpha/beta fold hydrolase [Xanthomonadales bacterium]